VLQPGNGAPDKLIKIDPRSGQTIASADYAWGIGSITTSPTAVWVAARRRARIQRVDPATAAVVKTLQVGRSRSQDIVYRAGSLWLATPEDNAVYKVNTSTGKSIPISVGQEPRQLAVGKDKVYVTNFSSSDLYVIDTKRSRVEGTPLPLSVNPFSLAVDGDTIWVGSVPENRLTKVTDHGG
jgi:YVTN family beta-propeller protein